MPKTWSSSGVVQVISQLSWPGTSDQNSRDSTTKLSNTSWGVVPSSKSSTSANKVCLSDPQSCDHRPSTWRKKLTTSTPGGCSSDLIDSSKFRPSGPKRTCPHQKPLRSLVKSPKPCK